MLSATNVTITGNSAGGGGTAGPTSGGDGGAAPDLGGNGGSAVGDFGGGGGGGDGGGVWLAGPGSTTILHGTIASNLAGGAGAGAAATRGEGGAGATPGAPGTAKASAPGAPGNGGATGSAAGGGTTLQNSIVASNSTPGCAGTVTDGGHDIALADPTCPGADIDPLLQPLAENGGPTETMALGPRSPALDVVPSNGADCPATDQRGVRRPQGAACDIGAFEVAVPAQTTPPPQGGTLPTTGRTPARPLAILARLSHVSLSPRAFRAAPAGPSALSPTRHLRFGTIVSYTLNQPASVQFVVTRTLPGRRVSGGRCVASSPSNRQARKCTRFVAIRGAFTRSGKLGANRFRFTGRIGGRHLSPGAYRLVGIPSVGSTRGVTVTIGFRIITPADQTAAPAASTPKRAAPASVPAN